MRAGHADVGDESRAFGEHALIRGGNVRVRAHDGRYTPIQVPSEADFLAGGFGVDVHQNEVHVRRNFGQLSVGFLERIVVGSQENPALHV